MKCIVYPLYPLDITIVKSVPINNVNCLQVISLVLENLPISTRPTLEFSCSIEQLLNRAGHGRWSTLLKSTSVPSKDENVRELDPNYFAYHKYTYQRHGLDKNKSEDEIIL